MKNHPLSLSTTCAVLVALGCAHQSASTVSEGPRPASERPAEARSEPQTTPRAPSRANDDVPAAPTIHFGFNQDLLVEDSVSRLTKLAESLRSHPSTKVQILGNCDERGTEEYNLALGQRRADVAKKYLVSLGVEPHRISTVTYGSERPVAKGHDEQAWAQNRRDEFEIRP